MIRRHVNIVVFTANCVFSICFVTNAQENNNESQIELSLRMIGHQILLSSNDSTSRVLPIVKENDQYRIQFESEFEFKPEVLVSTVDSVIKQSNIAISYIVEMEDCENNEIVYSFKMDHLEQSDIIPCKGRIQPQSCYSLLFTLIEVQDPNSVEGNFNYIFILLIIGLLALVIYLFWRNQVRSNPDPNLIAIGEYHFDKRNTELIIEHQKIELTSKEADLLLLLHNAANETVEREVILNMVWGDEGGYVGRTLDVFISKLRKKLEFDSKVKIVNIRGVGYKLVTDV